jgi:hypothetical protein
LPSPPSGAPRIPPLVLVTSTKGVGGCSIVTVPRCFVGAGCTCVPLAAAVPVRPTVVPRLWILCRPPQPCRSCRRSRHWSSLCPSRRINQFLVGCSENPNGGREGQICSRKLLENDRIICCCKSQVVKCCLQPYDCRCCRRKDAVSTTEWFPPSQSKDLMLVLQMCKAEGRLPRCLCVQGGE